MIYMYKTTVISLKQFEFLVKKQYVDDRPTTRQELH